MNLIQTSKSFVIALVAVMFVAAGCTALFDPVALAKANGQVKEFLDEYPNAEFSIVQYTANESTYLSDEFEENCAKQLTPKAMYRFYLNDPDSGLELIGYIDESSQAIDCIKKTLVESKDNFYDETKPPSVDREKGEYERDFKGEFWFEAFIQEEKVMAKWKFNNLDEVEYFKLMRSENPNPKYPDMDAHIVVEPHENSGNPNEFKVKFEEEEGVWHYRVSVVMKDGTVKHSHERVIHVGKDHFDGPGMKNESYLKEEASELLEEIAEDIEEIGEWLEELDPEGDEVSHVEDFFEEAEEYYYSAEDLFEEGKYRESLDYLRKVDYMLEDIEHMLEEYEDNAEEDKSTEELNIEFEYEVKDNKVYMEWEVNTEDEIAYYKILRGTQEHLEYPDDAYDVVSPTGAEDYEWDETEYNEGLFYAFAIIFDNDDIQYVEEFEVEFPDEDIDVDFMDFIINPEEGAEAGEDLIANVKIINQGDNEVDSIKVTIEVPDLDIEEHSYINNITGGDTVTSDDISLSIPDDADAGEYNVVIELDGEDFNEVFDYYVIDVIESSSDNQTNESQS